MAATEETPGLHVARIQTNQLMQFIHYFQLVERNLQLSHSRLNPSYSLAYSEFHLDCDDGLKAT